MMICDLFCRDSKTSSLLGKAVVLACPSNHQLEIGAVTNETPFSHASCDLCESLCLKTLPDKDKDQDQDEADADSRAW